MDKNKLKIILDEVLDLAEAAAAKIPQPIMSYLAIAGIKIVRHIIDDTTVLDDALNNLRLRGVVARQDV